MRAQLEYLLEICDRPGLTLQVHAAPGRRPCLAPSSFSILTFALELTCPMSCTSST